MEGETTSWRLGHRPALDGLRGVAIILVLASHAMIPGSGQSGAVGVGLFFTLSGFLITGLLLEERVRTGRVSFRRFYARRARRLLPAFLAMLAVCAVARVVLGPWFMDWSHLPAVLLYAGNWLPATGTNPLALGHTWTLSVEEQFYLVWPLVVAVVATRSRVVMVAACLAALSLVIRVVLLADLESIYRITCGSDTVAFAILVGAVTVGARMARGPGRSRQGLAAVGFLGLVGCVLLPSSPSVVLGLPLTALATAAVLWGVTGAGAVPWLEGRVLGWFGSRSYGIYVWHAPLMWSLGEHYRLSWWVVAAVGIPVALLAAELSFRFVEAPFRARKIAPAPAVAGAGAIEDAAVSGTSASRAGAGRSTQRRRQ